MDPDMKENMVLEENMELEHINGMMDLNTQGTGWKTRFLVLEYTRGLMEGSMKESGKIITWKV